MNKFKLFKKSESFYWSTNKIYYCALIFLLGLGYLSYEYFNPAERIFQWLVVITLIIGLILKFKGFTQIEPVQGKLEGDLIFEKDSIIIDNVVYLLHEIKTIKISNDDYSGKLVNTSKGQIGPALSNGTYNWIIIFLQSGKSKKYFFELINSNDFQNVRSQLINYYLNGKIEFLEVANVLGEKSNVEIQEFKKEVEKIGTAANSR